MKRYAAIEVDGVGYTPADGIRQFHVEHGTDGVVVDVGAKKFLGDKCRHCGEECGHGRVVPDVVGSFDEAVERGWFVKVEP